MPDPRPIARAHLSPRLNPVKISDSRILNIFPTNRDKWYEFQIRYEISPKNNYHAGLAKF